MNKNPKSFIKGIIGLFFIATPLYLIASVPSNSSSPNINYNYQTEYIIVDDDQLNLIVKPNIEAIITAAEPERIKGIYVTQYILQNKKNIKHLIKKAKEVGINTFVIDLVKVNKRYRENIKLVTDNNIKYVARIVIFPNGGSKSQVDSKKFWQKKVKLMHQAVDMGAEAIQLDYIRYSKRNSASDKNAYKINNIIKWYRDQLAHRNVDIQIDVFGETSFKPSRNIGQDVQLFAENIDVLCPMLYPSHYFPSNYHSKRPYETVLDSLIALQEQFDNNPPFKVYAYIEVRNFRYRTNTQGRIKYIYEQLRATKDGNADGWYAWSPENKYHNLFKVLEMHPNL